jgi:hypothetical protein
LTSAEQALVEHVSRGEWLQLAADDEVIDEAAMRSWDDARTCRATVIRDILRGRLVAEPDPHGLRLRGARIAGRLDLEDLSTDINLELKDCLLEEGLIARDAHLTFVGLIGCRLEHPTEPPLDGARLTCSVLTLQAATIIGHTKVGAVTLDGANIATVNCGEAELRNDSGPALYATGLQIGQDMLLSGGFIATASSESGAIHLLGAHIGGSLQCMGADLRNDSGPALSADGLQVAQGAYLDDGFTATGSGEYGAVRLAVAHIGNSLVCTGADLRNDSGPALVVVGIQVSQGVYLRGGFTATGSGKTSAVNLDGAHVGSNLDCTGADLRNGSGPALSATGLQVSQDVYLRGGFTATGSGESGAARLIDANLGSLDCTGATLRNDSGPALYADRLQVSQGVYLRGGFTATGSGESGAVRLTGAHIGRSLDCTGAALRNDSGPALSADRLQVSRAVYLLGGFTATGSGESGAVRLIDANLGSLDCTGATLRNDSGPALSATGLQVSWGMDLRGGFTAIGSGTSVAVDLTGTQVGGTLVFAPAHLEHAADPHSRLAVDGLTYAGVPKQVSAKDWLDLLRTASPSYAAQPYQQLAAGYRAQGDERQVREILMAQRDDQLTRTQPRPRWPERLWGQITKATLGYGYQPWRALLFLAGIMTISCLLAWALGSHGALAQTDKTATPGKPCTVIQQISVGLDLNLPVGTSVARTDCDLTGNSTSATAAWLTATSWVLRLLAWAFAALFIAGFTSAVRKT